MLEALNRIEVDGGYTDPHFTGEASRPIKIHPNVEGFKINMAIREQIVKELNVSEDTVRARLNVLCRSKYLSSDEGRGRKGKVFTLLYDVDEILRKLKEEAEFSNSPHSLKDEMEKEAQEFLNPKCKTKKVENEGTDETVTRKNTLEKVTDDDPHLNITEECQSLTGKAKENAENGKSPLTRQNDFSDVSDSPPTRDLLDERYDEWLEKKKSKEERKRAQEEEERRIREKRRYLSSLEPHLKEDVTGDETKNTSKETEDD